MTVPLRVLILEDLPVDAELMIDELRRAGFGPDWRCVDSEADYLAHLDLAPDIILADYSLPQWDAPSALRALQERGLDIPFIMISGTVGEDKAVECMKQGADDYLLKDRLSRLGPAVTKALEDRRLRVEKQQAEAALRESEEKFRNLFNNAEIGMFRTRLDGSEILDANEKFLEIFGRTREEVQGRPSVIHWADPREREDMVRRLEAEGRVTAFECRMLNKQGEVRICLTSLRLVREQGILEGSILDITDRKQAERELRTSETFLNSIIENSPHAMWISDSQGTLIRQNQACRDLLHITDDEVIGKYNVLQDTIVAEQGYLPLVKRVFEQGEIVRFTLEYKSEQLDNLELKEHVSVVLDVTISPVLNAEGHVIHAIIQHVNITERKRTEEALRQLSQAVEHSPSIVFITDADGRLEYVNPKYTEITGYTPEEAKGHLPRILDPDKISREEYEERWRTIRSGGEWRGEFQNRKKNGELFWQSVSISSIKDENGAISHFVLVMEDITVRKQAEAALQASEERLRTVLENMPVMLDALDEDLNIVVWNRECERVTGYSADEIIHHPNVAELLYPDPAYRARIQAELVSSDDYRGWEWETTCKDGSVKTIAWFNISHQYPVRGWARWGIGVDITERKLAEIKLLQWNDELEQSVAERTAELNHAKERIETILNSSSDVMILCRADGTIDQVNPAFRETFGYTSDAIFNVPLAGLITTENDTYRLEETFKTVVQTQHPMRLEITAHPQERPVFDADIVLSPVIGANDQLFGVVCSLRDNTARRQMEDKLRHMLEHEVELSELKSRYVSMAAHDLRNPLAVIRSAVDLVQQYGDRLTEEQIRTKYNHIQASIDVMVSLLDDILIIGQVESGKLAFNPAPLDVITFSQGLSMEIGQAAGAARRIVFSGQGDCQDVLVDAKLLRHILGNLLSNAIKYSPEGRDVIFSVDCQPDRITFCVQDHGIGIPEADRKHLFETFHRASNVRQIPGTGLGLAIVRQSVALHGGTISFESEVGGGTTFTVVLPQAETPASGDQAAGQRGTG